MKPASYLTLSLGFVGLVIFGLTSPMARTAVGLTLLLTFMCVAFFYFCLALRGWAKARSVAKFFASLKLAVLIIIWLGVVSAVGTVVESKYNLQLAQKWVYQTWYMWAPLTALALNLIGVMADRWPWKAKHASFILAHIGILLLLVGAILTSSLGIDGSMRVQLNSKNNLVTLTPTDVVVWTSFDGGNFVKLHESEVDFHKESPRVSPLEINLGRTQEQRVRVIDYKPFALGQKKIVPSDDARFGPALRFQIDNSNVAMTEWIHAKQAGANVEQDLGPALIVLKRQDGYVPPVDRNVVLLESEGKQLKIGIYKQGKKLKSAVLSEGDVFETGWMDLVFRVLRYIPHATEVWEFQDSEYPTNKTTEAVQVEFNGEQHWVQLNSLLKLFSDDAVFLFSYSNRRIPLGFELELADFRVGRYQGTMRAASYESDVLVPGVGRQTISMNNPLYHAGFAIYQSSFEEDEMKRPVASIFSVNYDPGRQLKYLGSLIIVLGAILLFWNKKRANIVTAIKKVG